MILKFYELQKNQIILQQKNIYLLYGENFGLKKDIQKLIIFQKYKNQKIQIISHAENEIYKSDENFYNSIFSGSLFYEKKILIITNVTDKFIKYLEDILKKKPNDLLIILFAENLEKKSKIRNLSEKDKNIFCIPCYPDTDRDLQVIAKKELSFIKVSLSQESINLIVDKANGDRNNLKNEIEKIRLFCINKKTITNEEINNLVTSPDNLKVENFVNKCLGGELQEFKKILSDLYLETVSYIVIIRIFSKKLERLLQIKKQTENENLQNVINQIKPPIFWKEKPLVTKQIKLWKKADLIETIIKLNTIELECKKNSDVSLKICLNFISNLCVKANSYS